MLKSKLNFAAIDIGSNAVRLLIKGINPGEEVNDLTKSLLIRVPLRLGEDAFGAGAISPDKEKRLKRTIKSFKLLMKVFNVVAYRACATSAMRDAKNGMAIAQKIRKKMGINIEVIDGNEEARIVYESHIGDLLDRDGCYIYVDVGGGSTEISLICDGALIQSRSYNIGTVRALSGKVKASEWEALKHDMDTLSAQYDQIQIIGSGGNINKLYRMSHSKVENLLMVDRLQELHDALAPLSYEERMEQFHLNPDRADVIIPASEIFLTVARHIGADSIFVPTIGIIDGITHGLCAKYLQQIQ